MIVASIKGLRANGGKGVSFARKGVSFAVPAEYPLPKTPNDHFGSLPDPPLKKKPRPKARNEEVTLSLRARMPTASDPLI